MFEVAPFESVHVHIGEALRVRLVAALRAGLARSGTALSQTHKIMTAPEALPGRARANVALRQGPSAHLGFHDPAGLMTPGASQRPARSPMRLPPTRAGQGD